MKRKQKKKLLVISTLSIFTMLGGTLAYFTTHTEVANKFKTALYENQIVETFESPTDWTPGTTTSKKIIVKNTGNVPMAVRASYTEKWISGNGNTLGTKDSLGNVAAIINFNDEWEKADDGYFYYGTKNNKKKVLSNDITTSFIDSVTFNENIEVTLDKSISSDGQMITYTSSGNGYDNATYTLTIIIDTIQYSLADSIW